MIRNCLLIVDVQKGFICPSTDHIPEKVELLQNHFDCVYATQFINAPNSPFEKFLCWNRMKEKEEIEFAFTPRLGAFSLQKESYTCVTKGFLEELALRKLGTVYLCGIDTDVCVTKCAVDLFENGIRPIVLVDYCASHGGINAHQRGIDSLARWIGQNQIMT